MFGLGFGRTRFGAEIALRGHRFVFFPIPTKVDRRGALLLQAGPEPAATIVSRGVEGPGPKRQGRSLTGPSGGPVSFGAGGPATKEPGATKSQSRAT